MPTEWKEMVGLFGATVMSLAFLAFFVMIIWGTSVGSACGDSVQLYEECQTKLHHCQEHE